MFGGMPHGRGSLPPGYRTYAGAPGVFWQEPSYYEPEAAMPQASFAHEPQHEEDAPLMPEKHRGVFVPGMRRRMNIIPMVINVFLPWIFFNTCLTAMGFRLHHHHPWMAWSMVGGCTLLWVGLVYLAVWARRTEPDPMWYSFAAVAVFIAIVAGTISGLAIYWTYFWEFYSVFDLKTINGLDPGKAEGQHSMDGGMFNFVDGSRLDISKAWHFKNHDLYCVAPIVPRSGQIETGSFDFWAVGKNCCSRTAADYRCGSYSDGQARGGLRMLEQQKGPFYRLAVEQAKSVYNIRADHPIFVEWLEDPRATINSFEHRGYSRFLVWSCAHLCFSTLCVLVAVWKFAFIGRLPAAHSKGAWAPSHAADTEYILSNQG